MTEIAIAVVEFEGLFLVGIRPEGTPLAGFAEFPGGKVEPGETRAEAAARECWEETGIEITLGEAYPEVRHRYEHDTLTLHFVRAAPIEFAQPSSDRYRWVPRAELAELQFPEANAALVRQLVDAGPPARDFRFWLGPAQVLLLLAFLGMLVNNGGQLGGGEGQIAALLGLVLLILPVVNHAHSRGRKYGLRELGFDITAIGVSLYFSLLAGPAFLLVWIPLLLLRRL